MKVIVTCGPSYEPIDDVRRLTNFSTGELGVLLSNELLRAGGEVFCLKGAAATYPGAIERGQFLTFTTNDSLADLLREFSGTQEIAAVFHSAALCDYKVKTVADAQGQAVRSTKISSRAGSLTLHLEPATKIISDLRTLFPHSLLVGWKYELAGTRDQALDQAWRQIDENRTDACVVNGAAYGSGFAFCTDTARRSIIECHDKESLVRFLRTWLEQRVAKRPG